MKALKKFKIDLTKNTFVGPKQYMDKRGNAYLKDIVTGKNEVFNMFKHESPDFETAVLVYMQTDYAAWKGFKESQTWMKRN